MEDIIKQKERKLNAELKELGFAKALVKIANISSLKAFNFMTKYRTVFPYEASGFKMGEAWIIYYKEMELCRVDNRQYYSGGCEKFNKNIRHGYLPICIENQKQLKKFINYILEEKDVTVESLYKNWINKDWAFYNCAKIRY